MASIIRESLCGGLRLPLRLADHGETPCPLTCFLDLMYDKSDGKSVTKTKRKRNENETKTIYPAVIGRQLNCFFPRPITAGYIVFVSFSFRFRFVFVADFPSLCHTDMAEDTDVLTQAPVS